MSLAAWNGQRRESCTPCASTIGKKSRRSTARAARLRGRLHCAATDSPEVAEWDAEQHSSNIRNIITLVHEVIILYFFLFFLFTIFLQFCRVKRNWVIPNASKRSFFRSNEEPVL